MFRGAVSQKSLGTTALHNVKVGPNRAWMCVCLYQVDGGQ